VLAAVLQGCATAYGGVWEKRVAASPRSILCAREEAGRMGYSVRSIASGTFSAEKWFTEGTEQSVGYLNGFVSGDSLTMRAERRRMGAAGRFPMPRAPGRPAASFSVQDTLTRPRPAGSDQLPPGPVATDAGRIVNRCRGA